MQNNSQPNGVLGNEGNRIPGPGWSVGAIEEWRYDFGLNVNQGNSPPPAPPKGCKNK